MMAGNVLGKGYTAGVGMSIGTAFGRIAGTAGGAGCLEHQEIRRSNVQQLETLTREARALANGEVVRRQRREPKWRASCRSAMPAATARVSAPSFRP